MRQHGEAGEVGRQLTIQARSTPVLSELVKGESYLNIFDIYNIGRALKPYMRLVVGLCRCALTFPDSSFIPAEHRCATGSCAW